MGPVFSNWLHFWTAYINAGEWTTRLPFFKHSVKGLVNLGKSRMNFLQHPLSLKSFDIFVGDGMEKSRTALILLMFGLRQSDVSLCPKKFTCFSRNSDFAYCTLRLWILYKSKTCLIFTMWILLNFRIVLYQIHWLHLLSWMHRYPEVLAVVLDEIYPILTNMGILFEKFRTVVRSNPWQLAITRASGDVILGDHACSSWRK